MLGSSVWYHRFRQSWSSDKQEGVQLTLLVRPPPTCLLILGQAVLILWPSATWLMPLLNLSSSSAVQFRLVATAAAAVSKAITEDEFEVQARLHRDPSKPFPLTLTE
jgi:hypothetical protein